MAPILVIWTTWLLAWTVESIGFRRWRWSTALIPGLVGVLGLFTYFVAYDGTIAPFVGAATVVILLMPILDAVLKPGAVSSRERAVLTVGVLLHPLVILSTGALWPILRGTNLMLGMFLPFSSESAQLAVVIFSGVTLLVCVLGVLRSKFSRGVGVNASAAAVKPDSPKSPQ